MSKTLESPVASMRLAAGARTPILVVARFLGVLIAEHSQALTATAKAALPRKRLTDLRAMYTAPSAKRASPAAEDNLTRANLTRAFKSPAMARRLVTGFNVVAALVIAWCLIAVVAA